MSLAVEFGELLALWCVLAFALVAAWAMLAFTTSRLYGWRTRSAKPVSTRLRGTTGNRGV